MTCYSGFGNLTDGNHRVWTDDFDGDGRMDVLFYSSGDDNWWLGTFNGTQLTWGLAGNTAGFGHGIDDGRPFWTGRFSRADRDEILFYNPGDDNWWLGTLDSGQLNWTLAGNTAGFGHGINDGRPFWTGRFSRADRDEILFYNPGDDNWWLGTLDSGQLNWTLAGNTAGFGHGINDGRPFWIGDFDGSARHDVLFYHPSDDNCWLGTFNGTQLTWGLAGNNAGIGHGINDGRPFWTGRFSRADRDEILFYNPGDDNWWLGTLDNGQLNWTLAGNTAGFGHGINDGRPFWTGRFSRADRDEILFYNPGDDNWWLGTLDSGQLNWTLAGNTEGFGHGINDGRPFWVGDFDGSTRHDVLFYHPGDGNWWLGVFMDTQLQWSFVGNTGRPCLESVVVHFKSLLQIDDAINRFIDTQFLAMHELFSTGGVAVFRGTTEDLNGNLALQLLQNLDVAQCLLEQPTQDQNTLFANRNNADDNDLVVYIVASLIGVTATGAAANFVGCATHPDEQPGAAVVQSNANWLVAHEVGHVLGLNHVCEAPTCASEHSDSLMFPNVDWTNEPPDLAKSEFTTMLNSDLTRTC